MWKARHDPSRELRLVCRPACEEAVEMSSTLSTRHPMSESAHHAGSRNVYTWRIGSGGETALTVASNGRPGVLRMRPTRTHNPSVAGSSPARPTIVSAGQRGCSRDGDHDTPTSVPSPSRHSSRRSSPIRSFTLKVALPSDAVDASPRGLPACCSHSIRKSSHAYSLWKEMNMEKVSHHTTTVV